MQSKNLNSVVFVGPFQLYDSNFQELLKYSSNLFPFQETLFRSKEKLIQWQKAHSLNEWTSNLFTYKKKQSNFKI